VIRFTEVAIGIALQGHVTGRAPQIEVNEVTMSALGHKRTFWPSNAMSAKCQERTFVVALTHRLVPDNRLDMYSFAARCTGRVLYLSTQVTPQIKLPPKSSDNR
jgi:hypothetical protein